MIIAYILAALAAVANAASSLLRREGNRRQRTIAPYRRPVWWAGVGAATVSFGLQAGALGKGSLAAIEPILALELVLVVFGAGLFFHMHIWVREWVSTGLLTVGTIVLVVALDPQKSHQISVLVWQWVVALGTSVAVIVASFLIATR
ncbi:MAG TPA: hypothetical protein VFH39_00385, partial [Candidatus Saccharimonadales bacterium]|nr:hypothetical protein [Candidatus Saccharimonadales bacterium]